MRMGKKYGDARLEAACARALAIGNPRLRSVEAILKSGLEKVALAEEVESKPVVHENIRGGDYFDREEVASRGEDEEIEARYLEDERQSIIHERRTEPTASETPRRQEDGWRDEVNQEVAIRTAPARMTEPLSALIGRAQALLSRPRVASRSGRQTADDRGCEDAQGDEDLGSSCMSQSMCVTVVGGDDGSLHTGEESSSQERMCSLMTCEFDEGWNASCGPRQGEE
jgi:hypothetical protein